MEEKKDNKKEKFERFKELLENGAERIRKGFFILVTSVAISLGGVKCSDGTIDPPVMEVKDESTVDVKVNKDSGIDIKDGVEDVGPEVGDDVRDVDNDVEDAVVIGDDAGNVADNQFGDTINDGEDTALTDFIDSGAADIIDVNDVGDDGVSCDIGETAIRPIPSITDTTEGGITVKYSFEGTQEYDVCTGEVTSQNIDAILIEFNPPLAKGNDGIPYINPSINLFEQKYIIQEIRNDPFDVNGKRHQILLIRAVSEKTIFDDCSDMSAKRHTIGDLNFICRRVASSTMLDFFNFANALGVSVPKGGIEGKSISNGEPVPLIAKLIDFNDNPDPKKVTYTVMVIENNYYYLADTDLVRTNCIKGDKCRFTQPPYQTVLLDKSEWRVALTTEEPNSQKCSSDTPCVYSIKLTRSK